PCGGHVDPSGYYHHHFGSSSIQGNLDAAGVDRTCSADQDEAALFGFAFDGYAIYGPHHGDAEPTDLDACSGHVADTDELGSVYHYHLTEESPNLPTCRVGAAAADKLTSPDNPDVSLPDTGGPGGGGGAPAGPPPGG
ncbi:MAG: YHYH protein, partial [Myxococcales bacterium]|nr:YHYH protein [Myxococcales bacterium]